MHYQVFTQCADNLPLAKFALGHKWDIGLIIIDTASLRFYFSQNHNFEQICRKHYKPL